MLAGGSINCSGNRGGVGGKNINGVRSKSRFVLGARSLARSPAAE